MELSQTSRSYNMSYIPKISPSRSKGDFFKRLGLNENSEEHKSLYREMMDEAARGRERTCQDPNNLTPQARSSASLTHPYSSNMITETALHREVLNIYYTASSRTKPWYDFGRYWEGTNEENWIIRWCLWHVFRYRDERNRHRGQGGPFYFFQEKEGGSDGYNVKYMKSMVPQEYKGYKIRRPSTQSVQMGDYLSGSASDGSEPPSEAQSDRLSEPSLAGEDSRSNRNSMYYDPVRDLYSPHAMAT